MFRKALLLIVNSELVNSLFVKCIRVHVLNLQKLMGES